MTDIEQILSEVQDIKNAQIEQRNDIKELSKAFGKLAVQNEQIGNLQIQQTALWERMEKIRDYQAGCPREQITKMENRQIETEQRQDLTLNRQWKVILGLSSAVIVGFGIIAKVVTG